MCITKLSLQMPQAGRTEKYFLDSRNMFKNKEKVISFKLNFKEIYWSNNYNR